MRRLLLIGLLGIGAIIFYASLAPRKVGEGDAALSKAPVAVTGEGDEQRRFAENLFGPEFFQAENSTDFAEEPGWRKAVEVMANLEPAFIADHLDFSLNVHYDEVLKNPSAYRGRFVRMRGIVGREFRAQKLDTPIAGRRDVYRGRISDPDGDSARTFFDVLDAPATFDTQIEAVDVDGVFYRTVRYEAQPKPGQTVGEFVEVPWIVARTVVPRNRDAKTSPPVKIAGIFLAFLALLGSIVYLVRGGRPRKAAPDGPPGSIRALMAERLRDVPRKEPPAPPGAGGSETQ
jgi:hypothetical protein